MSQAHGEGAIESAKETHSVVRSYCAPWKGQLLLACRKCQKKLKRTGKKTGLARLRKEIKTRTRQQGRVSVIEVSCLKLCPKDGVTVCTQQQLAKNQCSIVRSSADLDELLKQYKAV